MSSVLRPAMERIGRLGQVARLTAMGVRSVKPATGEALFTDRLSHAPVTPPILAGSKQETTMELGLYTFGDVGTDPVSGRRTDPAERIRNLLEEIELADQLGLDVFALGEHHRSDYVVSSPATVLAAAAARTKTIRLSSAVTVLSSEDPVRVFQQYATLDLISQGRAEMMAGRGSFIESFPLFGYDLKDYDTLFAEKLEMLMALRKDERITWPGGKHTARIDGRGVYPRPVQDPLPLW
ncbi:MAG: LLM class flavin-dependent oxidoreductase, partial [Dechloromonas sp.]|nr:LLM class flavin-dependent oxidoreductase [Dechloromonas sp.]